MIHHPNFPFPLHHTVEIGLALASDSSIYRPRDAVLCRTPRLRMFPLRIACLRLAPHPLVVRPAHSPPATPDRHWIDTFPFAAKSTCPSHPKPTAQAQASSPSHRPTSKAQDTAALRSTRRASPLPIAPRGLDLVSF
jgi:hypothetical protein